MGNGNGKPTLKGLMNWLPVFIVAATMAVGYASWKGATAAELEHVVGEIVRLEETKVDKSEYVECVKRVEQNIEKIDVKQERMLEDVGTIKVQQTRIEGKVDQLLSGSR